MSNQPYEATPEDILHRQETVSAAIENLSNYNDNNPEPKKNLSGIVNEMRQNKEDPEMINYFDQLNKAQNSAKHEFPMPDSMKPSSQ